MTWARVSSASIAVACALVIIAHAPAVLVEPLQNAVAQVRYNTYATSKPVSTAILASDTLSPQEEAVLPVVKAKKL